MIELSERDKKILTYLQQYDPDANGAPAPCYREIVSGCRLASTNQVRESLANLKFAGLIQWYPGVARSIRVIENGAGET